MLYLSGVENIMLRELKHPSIQLMIQPKTYKLHVIKHWQVYGADNGCFAETWDPIIWEDWLDAIVLPTSRKCLFAVVPDKVANNRETLKRWDRYADKVIDRKLPAAFVAQDGCSPNDIPSNASAVFIGGTTKFKWSEAAAEIIGTAQAMGLYTHIGRVNSKWGIEIASLLEVDSVDGTMLAFGYDVNIERLVPWLDTYCSPKSAVLTHCTEHL